MNLPTEIDPSWMFVAGCAMLTFILLKRYFRYFRKTRDKSSQPIVRVGRPANAWDGAQRDAMAHVERQKVEMFEISRDLNGELNSKIIILEKLLSQSQQQIARMEELIERGEKVS